MGDRGKIAVGLGLFLAAVLVPLWYPRAAGKPNRVLPQNATACIESAETMRASHMKLLDQWRTSVVRNGIREHVASNGAKYEMSLSRTCMHCHTSASQFCTPCHDYVGARLTCWGCHPAPEGRVR
jgi:hypothetical protein